MPLIALRSSSRFAVTVAGMLVSGLPPAWAQSDDDAKAACIGAHVRAQELRREGRLIEATGELDACGAESCPALVRKDCLEWREPWAAALPSIVVDARDRSNQDVLDVKLYVDDKLLAGRLDGRPIALDPGTHVLRGVLPDGTTVSTSILVREGEQRRRVVLRPPGPDRSGATEAEPTYHAGAWVPLAAVATIGTGLFAALAAVGSGMESDLEMCAPRCNAQDVSEMRSVYLAADVSLGVGAAGAVGLALYFAIAAANASPTSDDPRTTSFVVFPSEDGLTLGVRGFLPDL